MFRTPRIWLGTLALSLAATLSAAPARADVTKYLPDDTEIIFRVNIRQILDSALAKKHGVAQLKELINANDEARKALEALGLDLFKDVNVLTAAGPGGKDPEKGLFLIEGNFNAAKFNALAEQAAKDHPDTLKISKIGEHKVWEVTIPDLGQTLHVLLLDKNTLVGAPSKDGVREVIDRAAGKKKGTLNKNIKALLDKTSPKQSLSFLAQGSALVKSLEDGPIPKENLKDVLPFLKDLKGISGGLTIEDNIKVQFAVDAKDAKTARELSDKIDVGIGLAKFFVTAQAQQDKRWEPAVDVLRTLRVDAEGSFLIFRAEVTEEIIGRVLKILNDQ